MAFLGVAPEKTKAEIRSKSGMILLMKSSDFISLIPADQATKAISLSIAASKTIYALGVSEHKTIKTPVVNGDSVVDQFKSTIVTNKNLEGEAMLLGEYENDDLDGLEDESWTILVADPTTVTTMPSYDKTSKTLIQVAAETFTVHQIIDKININVGEGGNVGETQRTPITFTKELDSMSDGRYKNIEFTITA